MYVQSIGLDSSIRELYVAFKKAARLIIVVIAMVLVGTAVLLFPILALSDRTLYEVANLLWPIAVTTFLISSAGIVLTFRKRDKEWEKLVEEFPATIATPNPNQSGTHICGGVRFEDKLFGPFTLSVLGSGVVLSKLGKARVFLSWEDVSEVCIRSHANGGESAILKIFEHKHLGDFELKLLWDESFTPQVPSAKRRRTKAP